MLVEQAANAVKRVGLLAGCLDMQQLCRIGCEKLCMVLQVAQVQKHILIVHL